MDIKKNKSTINRPGGSRTIDAPYVAIDINFYMHQVKDEEAWQKSDRNAITVFKTEGLSLVLSALHADAIIDDNTADGILIVQVLEGKIKITADEHSEEAVEKEIITFHRDVAHTIEALEESVLLLTITGE